MRSWMYDVTPEPELACREVVSNRSVVGVMKRITVWKGDCIRLWLDGKEGVIRIMTFCPIHVPVLTDT